MINKLEARSKRAAKKYLMNSGMSPAEADRFIAFLLQRVANLNSALMKFLPGVVRWIVEGQLDIAKPTDMRKLDKFLYNLKGTPEAEFYNNDFNGNTFGQVCECLQLDLDAGDYQAPEDITYRLVELSDYGEMERYEGRSIWCILDRTIFNAYTADGQRFYIAERSDYENVPKSKGADFPYDDYGMSLIVIGTRDGKVVSVTSRWNFDYYSNEYLTVEQLKGLLGAEFGHLQLK